jgi:uncharacterized protein YndB with AHSA1/START domain
VTDRTREGATKTEGELVITRVFDAPRELVWQAWTEPEMFMRWWGPTVVTTPAARIDLRVGGSCVACMRLPDGKDVWSTSTYREIVPPERLVMTDSFADENGNVVPASHYGMASGWPLELLITLTLEDLGGKTRLTLRHSGIAGVPAEDAGGMEQGWSESFDKLAALVEGAR